MSSGYVCEELIDNIFKRLPPKSLLRFRCLSKSWCSRISSPDFIPTHVLRFHENPQKVIIKHWTCSKKRMKEFYTLHSEDQLPLTRKHGYMGIGTFPCNDCSIVGSCNGLLCLFNHESGSITLWNPSIRRKLTLPHHPYMRSYSLEVPARVAVGFGFETNDYKIVRISYYMYKRDEPKTMVYTINTGTWRAIASPTTRFSNVQCSACFVNGALHWIVTEQDIRGHCYIMSFNLSTEVFGRVSLPEPSSEARELTIINGCLGVIAGECDNPKIWVMREDDNKVASWSMFFKLEPLTSEGGIHRVLLLTTNGDLVFLTYREGYKVYNPTTGVRSRIVKFNSCSYPLEIERYVESLVLLDKGTVCNGDQPSWLRPKKRKQKKKTSE